MSDWLADAERDGYVVHFRGVLECLGVSPCGPNEIDLRPLLMPQPVVGIARDQDTRSSGTLWSVRGQTGKGIKAAAEQGHRDGISGCHLE